jgi:hypothetical protein
MDTAMCTIWKEGFTHGSKKGYLLLKEKNEKGDLLRHSVHMLVTGVARRFLLPMR